MNRTRRRRPTNTEIPLGLRTDEAPADVADLQRVVHGLERRIVALERAERRRRRDNETMTAILDGIETSSDTPEGIRNAISIGRSRLVD